MTDEASRREVLQSVLAGVTLPPASGVEADRDTAGEAANVPDLGDEYADDLVWIGMAAAVGTDRDPDWAVETYTYIWRISGDSPRSDRSVDEVESYIRKAARGEYDDEEIVRRTSTILDGHEIR